MSSNVPTEQIVYLSQTSNLHFPRLSGLKPAPNLTLGQILALRTKLCPSSPQQAAPSPIYQSGRQHWAWQSTDRAKEILRQVQGYFLSREILFTFRPLHHKRVASHRFEFQGSVSQYCSN